MRGGWASASPDARAAAQGALVAALDAYIAGAPGRGEAIVARRLCLALACAAALGGGAAIAGFLDNALGLAESRPSENGLAVALELIACIAAEALLRPHAARDVVADEIAARLPLLLPLLAHVCTLGRGEGGRAPPLGPLAADALRCLKVCSRAGAGLPAIARLAPPLLTALFAALRLVDGSVPAAGEAAREAVEVLTELAGALCEVTLGPGGRGAAGGGGMEGADGGGGGAPTVASTPPPPSAELNDAHAALAQLVDAVLEVRRPILAAVESDEAGPLLAALVVTVADAGKFVLASGDPRGAALIEVLLALTRSGAPRVVCVAAEFWPRFAAVPPETRAPRLRAPLFAEVLPSLLGAAAYPGGFTSWDEQDPDVVTEEVRAGGRGLWAPFHLLGPRSQECSYIGFLGGAAARSKCHVA